MPVDRGLVFLAEPRFGRWPRPAATGAFRFDAVDRIAGQEAFDAQLLLPFLGAGHPIGEALQGSRPVVSRSVLLETLSQVPELDAYFVPSAVRTGAPDRDQPREPSVASICTFIGSCRSRSGSRVSPWKELDAHLRRELQAVVPGRELPRRLAREAQSLISLPRRRPRKHLALAVRRHDYPTLGSGPGGLGIPVGARPVRQDSVTNVRRVPARE